MGIQITFYRTRPVSFYERMRDKLKACFEALKFFYKGSFFPEEAEIWFIAPSEALGGRLYKRVPAENPYQATDILYERLKELPFEDVNQAIVVFRGIWQFNETRLGGYFSMHNSGKWREVYGDIHISAYAKGEFEDLVDAIWHDFDPATLIPAFIKTLKRQTENSSIGLSQVIFSRGIPTEEDPTNLMAAFFTGERIRLLGVFYKALRVSRDPEVIIKAKPLSTPFLIKTLVKEEIAMKRISERLQKALVIEEKDKSALYIAKKRDSFAKLYKEVSQAVLKPALNRLPRENDVTELIQRGLEEYREED